MIRDQRCRWDAQRSRLVGTTRDRRPLGADRNTYPSSLGQGPDFYEEISETEEKNEGGFSRKTNRGRTRQRPLSDQRSAISSCRSIAPLLTQSVSLGAVCIAVPS